METISKKKKLIPFLIFMVFSLPSPILTNVLARLGSKRYETLSAKDLNVFKIGGILFSLYAIIAPWFFESFFLPLFRKNVVQNPVRRRVSPETLILLMSYTMLFSIVMVGELLFDLGLPIAQVNYFFGTGILGALVWFIYTLRKGVSPRVTT
jgi:hypothetical protein